MKIGIEGEKIFVSGSGSAFVHFKTSLKAVGAFPLTEKRNLIGFSKRQAGKIHELLAQYSIEASSEDLAAIKNWEAESRLHASAVLAGRKILLSQETMTIDHFWDSTLDPHQLIAVKALLVPGLQGACLFDEQGIGKTLTALAAFDRLVELGRADAIIVVAPKNMVCEWPKELHRFLSSKFSVSVIDGTASQKKAALNRKAQAYFVSFESVKNNIVSLSSIATLARTVLVVDESFLVKNQTSNRSIAVRELREKCVFGLVICGTPAPNSANDIIHQVNIADDGIAFCDYKEPADPLMIGPVIAARLEDRVLAIRRLKADVLPNLAQKTFEVVRVRLKGRQLDLYQRCKEELSLFLRGLDNLTFQRQLTSYFQKRSALLAACVSPCHIDPSFEGVPVKYEELDKLVGRLAVDGKIVIWSFFALSIEELVARYSHLGVVRIDGSVPAEKRRLAVEMFQNDDSIRIFVGNPAAAGAGITLHAASVAIYVSFSNQVAHFLQSIDRIHRRGQLSLVVTIILLVAEGTIEEGEMLRLRRKIDDQHVLLGDQISWPSSLNDALKELE